MKQVTVGLVLCTVLVFSFGQEVLQDQKLDSSLKANSRSHKDKSANSTSNKGGSTDGDVNQNQTVPSVNVNRTDTSNSSQNAEDSGVKTGQERLQDQLDRSLKIIQTQARAFYQRLEKFGKSNKSGDKDKNGNATISERGSTHGDINQNQTVGSANVNNTDAGNTSQNAEDQEDRLSSQQLDRSVKIIQSPGKPFFPAQEKSDKNQNGSADGDINQNQLVGSVNVNQVDANNAGGSSTTQNPEDSAVKIGQRGNLPQNDQPTRSARIARSARLVHPQAKSHKKERDNTHGKGCNCGKCGGGGRNVDQEQDVGEVNTDTNNDDDVEDPGLNFGLTIGSDDDPSTRGHYKKDRHHHSQGKKHAVHEQVKKARRHHEEKRNKA